MNVYGQMILAKLAGVALCACKDKRIHNYTLYIASNISKTDRSDSTDSTDRKYWLDSMEMDFIHMSCARIALNALKNVKYNFLYIIIDSVLCATAAKV